MISTPLGACLQQVSSILLIYIIYKNLTVDPTLNDLTHRQACYECDMLQRDCMQLPKGCGHANCSLLGEQQTWPNLAESAD